MNKDSMSTMADDYSTIESGAILKLDYRDL
jgi:hypothetical protein